MALKITEECINCGACINECPNSAIYEGGNEWRLSDGTSRVGEDAPQPPKAQDVYYIVNDKCTECVGFHDEPQCAAVCPVDVCVKDPLNIESPEQLLAKKESLH